MQKVKAFQTNSLNCWKIFINDEGIFYVLFTRAEMLYQISLKTTHFIPIL